MDRTRLFVIIAAFSASCVAQSLHDMDPNVLYERVESRVKALAGEGAISCGTVTFEGETASANRCVRSAFKAGKPFYVVYESVGFDSATAEAFVMDSTKKFHWLEADSMGFSPPFRPHTKAEEEGHILVEPCPKPYSLTERSLRGGPKPTESKTIVTCFASVNHGPVHDSVR